MATHLLRVVSLSALAVTGVLVGCHHSDHDDDDRGRREVVIYGGDPYEHRGYYDGRHDWHGGYYDHDRNYHEDPRDFHGRPHGGRPDPDVYHRY